LAEKKAMSCFITFEGIEGCGKTTQIRLLAETLQQAGRQVTLTREPGGCPIADKIRSILLDAQNSSMTPLAELLLYAAARAQHISEVILPALARGSVVLCDRFTDATIAYQGFGRNLDRAVINQLNTLAAGSCRPDITFLLDCPVDTGLGRAIARIEASGASGSGKPLEERFERESREFHDRVRAGYLSLAAAEPERFILIDGSSGINQTAATIFRAVVDRIAR
jgi:dTMP kinase